MKICIFPNICEDTANLFVPGEYSISKHMHGLGIAASQTVLLSKKCGISSFPAI
jgi:hypothetical protein